MIMARLVEKEGHGIFVIVNAIIFFFIMASQAGMGQALVRRKENSREIISFTFYATLILSIISILIIFLTKNIVISIYGQEKIGEYLLAASLALIFAATGSIARGLLVRDLSFKRIFYSQCGAYFLGNIVIGTYLAYNGFEVWAFVIGLVCYHFFAFVFYFISRPFSLVPYLRKQEFDQLYYFSSSYTITEIFNNSAQFIDKLLLGKFLGPVGLAIFEKGQQVPRLPVRFFGNAFDNVFYSYLAKINENQKKVKGMYLDILGLLSMIIFFMASFLSIFSKNLIIFLLGVKWLDAHPVFIIFGMVLPFLLFAKMSDVLFKLYNRLFLASRIKFVFLVSIILATVFFSSNVKMVSVALAVCYIIYVFLSVHFSKSIINVKWGEILKTISPAFRIGLMYLLINFFLGNTIPPETGRMITILIVLFIDFLIMLAILNYMPSFFGKNNIHFVFKILDANPFSSHSLYLKAKEILLSKI